MDPNPEATNEETPQVDPNASGTTELTEEAKQEQTPEATPAPQASPTNTATIRVVKSTKEFVQANNADVVRVECEIVDVLEDGAESVVDTRSFDYPLDTTDEAIKADLKQCIDTYNAEKVQKAENAERDAAQKNADATIQSLEGFQA